MERAPGTQVTEDIQLTERLGEEGLTTAWLAYHAGLEADVVVKFATIEGETLDDDALDRFQNDTGAAGQIDSPHLGQMLERGVAEDGSPYIVTELLAGYSLAQWIQAAGPLGVRETAAVISQVCGVLAEAHGQEVLHGRLTPHNIFLLESEELSAALLDLGLPHLSDLERAAETGACYYLSPELVAGVGEHNVRTDLWALAVIAYETLTGELPFVGDSMDDLAEAITIAEPQPASQLLAPGAPESLDEWFSRAFHYNPAGRFRTAAEFAMGLHAAVNEATAAFLEAEAARADEAQEGADYAGDVDYEDGYADTDGGFVDEPGDLDPASLDATTPRQPFGADDEGDEFPEPADDGAFDGYADVDEGPIEEHDNPLSMPPPPDELDWGDEEDDLAAGQRPEVDSEWALDGAGPLDLDEPGSLDSAPPLDDGYADDDGDDDQMTSAALQAVADEAAASVDAPKSVRRGGALDESAMLLAGLTGGSSASSKKKKHKKTKAKSAKKPLIGGRPPEVSGFHRSVSGRRRERKERGLAPPAGFGTPRAQSPSGNDGGRPAGGPRGGPAPRGGRGPAAGGPARGRRPSGGPAARPRAKTGGRGGPVAGGPQRGAGARRPGSDEGRGPTSQKRGNTQPREAEGGRVVAGRGVGENGGGVVGGPGGRRRRPTPIPDSLGRLAPEGGSSKTPRRQSYTSPGASGGESSRQRDSGYGGMSARPTPPGLQHDEVDEIILDEDGGDATEQRRRFIEGSRRSGAGLFRRRSSSDPDLDLDDDFGNFD